jgi:hypothetical protein
MSNLAMGHSVLGQWTAHAWQPVSATPLKNQSISWCLCATGAEFTAAASTRPLTDWWRCICKWFCPQSLRRWKSHQGRWQHWRPPPYVQKVLGSTPWKWSHRSEWDIKSGGQGRTFRRARQDQTLHELREGTSTNFLWGQSGTTFQCS